MKQKDQNLSWRENVPIAAQFNDPFFSFENGLAETEYVFLGGNDLPARFAPGFHIGELGFGTGLNFLATLRAWHKAQTPGPLHYTSFEAYPLSDAQIARALSPFRDIAAGAKRFHGRWMSGRIVEPDVVFTLIQGDARETLPTWSEKVDAWFLDGFAPAKNPEMWEVNLIESVAQHTKPGGTAATYTAAGEVRRALTQAGFQVTRHPGFGRKRHMIRCRLANI